jgi:hypothetical protein
MHPVCVCLAHNANFHIDPRACVRTYARRGLRRYLVFGSDHLEGASVGGLRVQGFGRLQRPQSSASAPDSAPAPASAFASTFPTSSCAEYMIDMEMNAMLPDG